MTKKSEEAYSSEEVQKRFDAALRGARTTGHKSKDDLRKKRTSKKAPLRKKAKE